MTPDEKVPAPNGPFLQDEIDYLKSQGGVYKKIASHFQELLTLATDVAEAKNDGERDAAVTELTEYL